MKILVCISKVPDTTAKITFTDDQTAVKKEGLTYILNPTDEWYALIRAIELKEATNGEVSVIHVGTTDSEQLIRKALALGADKAFRIDTEPQDAFYTATAIANFAKNQHYDLILTGKETIDFHGDQVGAMIAEHLNLPFVAWASRLDIENKKAILEKEISGGKEILEAEFPLVVSASKGMAEAKIPNMKGIMAARSKPLEIIEHQQNIQPKIKAENYTAAPSKAACKIIPADDIQQLIDILHTQAKAI